MNIFCKMLLVVEKALKEYSDNRENNNLKERGPGSGNYLRFYSTGN